MGKRLQKPAVVLNCQTAGIGVIHALSRAPIDIATMDRNWPPLVRFGWYSRFPKVHGSYWPATRDAFVQALIELSNDFDGKGVLFPTTDEDLEWLIDSVDRLSERYHVPVAKRIGLNILEKNWQYRLADRTGVPTPRHRFFIGGEPPDTTSIRFPVILKPSTRDVVSGSRMFRLRLLEGPDDLSRCLEDIARNYAGHEFQVCENIPGDPDQLYTVGSYSNREGHVLRSYTGRKVTQYPYFHGMASVAESLAVPSEVIDQARTLLEAAGFHGISQVEFKYDARDGLYKLLEINGRAWHWIKLAAFSGVNLPLIQYYDLTGDPRLAEVLAKPQVHDRFYVNEYHVRLNRMPAEHAVIRELRDRKAMISAARLDGEWQLSLAFRFAALLKSLRRRVSGEYSVEHPFGVG
jgi:D-aspartate ligase